MGNGLFTARKMQADRQKIRWLDRGYKKRVLKLRRSPILSRDPHRDAASFWRKSESRQSSPTPLSVSASRSSLSRTDVRSPHSPSETEPSTSSTSTTRSS